MAQNFYIGKDADIVAGAANFAAMIAESPESLGLTVEQSDQFELINATLQSAYLAATNPSTRTSPAVRASRDAIVAMRKHAIMLAQIIRSTASVSDAQLVSLRLSPRPVRTRRAVPATPPTIRVISVVGRAVILRVTDPTTESRGLPFGAVAANLYSFVGDEGPDDPRAYHFEGTTTRAKMQIVFPDNVASGATVWLSANWVSGRGERSAGSVPISFTLQGGLIGAAA